MSGLYLLDTSVATEVRDRSQAILDKLDQLNGRFAISVITRVELEGGVHREPTSAALRRQRLDVFFRICRSSLSRRKMRIGMDLSCSLSGFPAVKS
jgi:predicted nucleic acid-binding protein